MFVVGQVHPEHRMVWAGCAASAGGVVFGDDKDRAIEMPDMFGGSQVSERCFQLFITQRCHQDCGDCCVLEELADQ